MPIDTVEQLTIIDPHTYETIEVRTNEPIRIHLLNPKQEALVILLLKEVLTDPNLSDVETYRIQEELEGILQKKLYTHTQKTLLNNLRQDYKEKKGIKEAFPPKSENAI